MIQLTAAELQTLTGWKRSSDQDRWLTERGIPHQRDGKRVIVLWSHVNGWIEGKPMSGHTAPNWNAVR